MKLKKKQPSEYSYTSKNGKRARLAIVKDEEREELAVRHGASLAGAGLRAQAQALLTVADAADARYSDYVKELRDRYTLPQVYSVDFSTGEVFAVDE